MHEIIEVLIKTVRVHEGIDPNAPISDEQSVELELRLKAHVASLLGICTPSSVKNDNLNAKLLSYKQKESHA